jgi:hypothetical protein
LGLARKACLKVEKPELHIVYLVILPEHLLDEQIEMEVEMVVWIVEVLEVQLEVCWEAMMERGIFV